MARWKDRVEILLNVIGLLFLSLAFEALLDDNFPLKSWLQVTYPLLIAGSFDTFCFVVPRP